MTGNDKPIFLFVPGAWHQPEAFDGIRALMAKRGLQTAVVALPSVGAEPPTKGLHDDIDHVRATITHLADDGRQVVVVAHSYGGMVCSGAVQGLEYSTRQARSDSGQKGGVIMLVYMTAFVAPKGSTLLDMLGGEWLPWMKFDGDYSYSSSEETVFYSDLAPAEQKKWIAKLRHHSKKAFLEPVPHEPWHDLPCTYLFCEKDLGLPMAVQESFAKRLGSESTTFRCEGAHSPFLSVPEQVIERLELAAKEGAVKSGVSVN